ncbi:putative dipeptidyl-peptidase II [Helianthus annuus]|nr:putative dipeptidyl-peptidase II [Helianthus annuus]
MAPWVLVLPLFYSLPFLQYSPSTFAKFQPRYFPSSITHPKSQSLHTNNKLYKTKYFTQILDHFNYNPQSYQTFQQRYLVNDTFWGGPKINAPIFVYTGNEGNIEWFA